MKQEELDALVLTENDGDTDPVPERGLPMGQERVGPSALQVVRGTAGIAVIWAGAWAALGLGLGIVLSLLTPFPMTALIPSLISWGVAGFLTGAGFATLLTTIERKNLLEELSVPRTAVWGALGGFAVSFLVFLAVGVVPAVGLGLVLVEGAKAGVLGALSATATTLIAKSGGGERATLEPRPARITGGSSDARSD